jgi:hypothetical protein
MILHRPSPYCDRNCSGRQGGGRSTQARHGTPPPYMIRAAPSLRGMSSISMRCGGNELVTMLRPPASGAWSNRGESRKVAARDQAPKVSPAGIPILHGWTDRLGHADAPRGRRRWSGGEVTEWR